MINSNEHNEKLLKNVEILKNYINLSVSEKKILIKKLINISNSADDFRYLNAALKVFDSLDNRDIDNNLIKIKSDALTYVRGKVLKYNNKNENNFNN